MGNDIDALFGSKTRVKLLNLFLANPDKSYYVREITRVIGEQVNSVRRELANMQNVGVVKSTTKDRKLFYEVNTRYKYYTPLRAMFAGAEIHESVLPENSKTLTDDWKTQAKKIKPFVKVFIIAGVLIGDSKATTDMLIVGDNTNNVLSKWAASVEKKEGRDLNYSIISFEEFYYRLSIRDKFITDIVEEKHKVIIDTDNVLKTE